MNWTEGNLHRHARGRTWNRDCSRQRRAFANARAPRAPRTPTNLSATAVGETSPFFTIGALSEPSPSRCHPPIFKAAAGPPPSTKRKLPSMTSHGKDDLETKRRRLLERPDWTGISGRVSPVVQPRDETPPCQVEPPRGPPSPPLHLHHPKPMRRDGAKVVRSLESRTYRAEPTPTPNPSTTGSSPYPRPSPYPRVAASVGTEGTEETDNLLPLSDTLPDVTVRLDILDRVGEDDGSYGEIVMGGANDDNFCTGPVMGDADDDDNFYTGSIEGNADDDDPCTAPDLSNVDDVTLTTLLSEGSAGLNVDARGISPQRQDRGTDPECPRETVSTPGEGRSSQVGEENWFDFVFEGSGEEVVREAFEVARRDAARSLVPSVSSASGADSRAVECDSESGCGGSDRATCGTGS
ncbi:uncharacterized protein DNG_09326 [Cephalotrichum gorgonifer]|uniref:Uncharacterized protein n=1 Tax=Cephalotrichum gorgonifer TaxID=2041049 RepID=A0AAE8N730_9PEZI|nr:uncharacterized protein DNG_09326 [Cephalotrichum gorgonifer]